jgi:hypothetical protein
MEYESIQKEEYNPYDRLFEALKNLNNLNTVDCEGFSDDNSYYVDIRVEIPSCDAEIFEDAVDIGQEFVDLLVEQEENKYYNIYLKTVSTY